MWEFNGPAWVFLNNLIFLLHVLQNFASRLTTKQKEYIFILYIMHFINYIYILIYVTYLYLFRSSYILMNTFDRRYLSFCLECTHVHIAVVSFNNVSMWRLMKGRKSLFLVFYMTKFNLMKAFFLYIYMNKMLHKIVLWFLCALDLSKFSPVVGTS